jgi:hypothetical protein
VKRGKSHRGTEHTEKKKKEERKRIGVLCALCGYSFWGPVN